MKKRKMLSSKPAALFLLGIFALCVASCDSDRVDDIFDVYPTIVIEIEPHPSETVAANGTITLTIRVYYSSGSITPEFDIFLELIDKFEAGNTAVGSPPDGVTNLTDVDEHEVFYEAQLDSNGEAEFKVTSSVHNSTYKIDAYINDEFVRETITLIFI